MSDVEEDTVMSDEEGEDDASEDGVEEDEKVKVIFPHFVNGC